MPTDKKELVSLVRCKRYHADTVRESLCQLLEPWGGIDHIIRPGQKVLLKPNLLAAAKPNEAVTTHPLLIKILTEFVQGAGGLVFIGDSSGSDSDDYIHRETGMHAVALETGAQLIKFDRIIQKDYDGIKKRKLDLAAALDEVDLVINVAKLKTHPLTGLTGAVKNTYGCLVGKTKKRMHFDFPLPLEFSRFVVDLYMAVKPEFSIIDAVIAMEGMGPRRGKPRNTGLLMASRNAVALDCVAAAVTGFKSEQVTTLTVARELQLPGADLMDIEIEGLSMEEALIKDFDQGLAASGKVGWLITHFPSAWARGVREKRRPYPSFNKYLCDCCGRCALGCPAQIIKLSGSIPEIDPANCIRCYCCQEFCPRGAIELTTKR